MLRELKEQEPMLTPNMKGWGLLKELEQEGTTREAPRRNAKQGKEQRLLKSLKDHKPMRRA
eukprot:959103-Pelagomonas_calceolata.AAC.1